jgi:hypothetical protein
MRGRGEKKKEKKRNLMNLMAKIRSSLNFE